MVVKQCVIVLFVDKEELLTKPSVLAKNTSHFVVGGGYCLFLLKP